MLDKINEIEESLLDIMELKKGWCNGCKKIPYKVILQVPKIILETQMIPNDVVPMPGKKILVEYLIEDGDNSTILLISLGKRKFDFFLNIGEDIIEGYRIKYRMKDVVSILNTYKEDTSRYLEEINRSKDQNNN